jgi:hypothetical protein
MQRKNLPEWEKLLSSAAHLRRILPEAVLEGGTASALLLDDDHVHTDLRERFDEVLSELESVAGWRTARIKRPVMILGSLDGIETGVRQLIRDKPLETTRFRHAGVDLVVPTQPEILRIKVVLILKRNATRDYLDFAALADCLGEKGVVQALKDFDSLYPQPNQESALQQLQIQLAAPIPFDLEETNLREYKKLKPRWQDWGQVESVCWKCAAAIMQEIFVYNSKRKNRSRGLGM